MSFFKNYLASLLAIFTSGCLFIFLFVFGSVALVGMLATELSDMEMPNVGGKEVVMNDNSVLVLTMEGVVTEQTKNDISSSILGEKQMTISLQDIITSVRAAAKDSRIKGIYLKVGLFDASYATLEEIRKEIEDFKKSGKFVWAYSGNYSQGGYYLATVADVMYLNPVGSVEFKGVSTSAMFYKDLLDTLGVDMQVIKVGTYKSFTEQYTNDSMSVENRSQMTHLVGSIWKSIKKDIMQQRSFSEYELDSIAGDMISFRTAEKVLEYGLVNTLAYADEVLSHIALAIGVEKEHLSDHSISVKDYANVILKRETVVSDSFSPKVAVYFADGEIDNGGSGGISSTEVVKQLNEFANDKNLFAVVLRVNSPGGSAYGAEQMWHAVENLKKKVPVIVSMGDYAASGGYYMSAGATRIFADEKTITGSIGVFSVIPNVKGLVDRLGVSHEVVSSGKNTGSFNVLRPLSEDERVVLQEHVNSVYELFLKRCSEGRNLSRDQVASIAEGRVWSGTDALSHGLVDEIGSLREAIEYAAKSAKIEDNYKIEYFPRPKNIWEQWMQVPSVTYSKFIEEKFPLQYQLEQEKRFLEKACQMDHVQAMLPYNFELN